MKKVCIRSGYLEKAGVLLSSPILSNEEIRQLYNINTQISEQLIQNEHPQTSSNFASKTVKSRFHLNGIIHCKICLKETNVIASVIAEWLE